MKKIIKPQLIIGSIIFEIVKKKLIISHISGPSFIYYKFTAKELKEIVKYLTTK